MSIATGSSSRLKGTGYDVVQSPRYSPEIMDMIQKLRGQVEPGALSSAGQLSKLAGGGDEAYWKQLEAPAMRQFGELQGQIASRFSGAGMGARKSSGFQNAQSGAAASLAEQLQSNRLGLQQNAQKQLLDLYTQLIGHDPYKMKLMEPKKKGLNWGNAFKGGASGATAGSIFGPWGSAAGGVAGGLAGLFSD